MRRESPRSRTASTARRETPPCPRVSPHPRVEDPRSPRPRPLRSLERSMRRTAPAHRKSRESCRFSFTQPTTVASTANMESARGYADDLMIAIAVLALLFVMRRQIVHQVFATPSSIRQLCASPSPASTRAAVFIGSGTRSTYGEGVDITGQEIITATRRCRGRWVRLLPVLDAAKRLMKSAIFHRDHALSTPTADSGGVDGTRRDLSKREEINAR